MARRRLQNVRRNLRRRSRRSRPRRRNGRRSSSMHYVETIPVSIEVGSRMKLSYADLKHKPSDCNFRIQYIHFVGTTAYEVEEKSKEIVVGGHFAPTAIQLTIFDSEDSIAATTGPVMLGVNPRNVKIYQPRQSDWVPPNIVKTQNFGFISSACVGNPSRVGTSYVRGIVHVLVKLGAIMVNPTCPALQASFTQTLKVSSLSDEVLSPSCLEQLEID